MGLYLKSDLQEVNWQDWAAPAAIASAWIAQAMGLCRELHALGWVNVRDPQHNKGRHQSKMMAKKEETFLLNVKWPESRKLPSYRSSLTAGAQSRCQPDSPLCALPWLPPPRQSTALSNLLVFLLLLCLVFILMENQRNLMVPCPLTPAEWVAWGEDLLYRGPASGREAGP